MNSRQKPEGKRFRDERVTRDLAGKDIAGLLGIRISQSEVSKFERGELESGYKADRLRDLLEQWERDNPRPLLPTPPEARLKGNDPRLLATASDLEAAAAFIRQHTAEEAARYMLVFLGKLAERFEAAGLGSANGKQV